MNEFERKEMLKEAKKISKSIKNNKHEAKQLLIKVGIIDNYGNLTKPYR